ncbi:MAG: hypothetical protein ACI4O7_05110 [Aristaeellaceae bacterium]
MRKGFFSRFYEGWTEERLPGDDGRLHTRRTYRDWWYVPRLTPIQRRLRAAGYTALYLGGVALFILAAAQPCPCNSTGWVAVIMSLALVSAVIEAIPLFTCAFGKEKQTVYQLRSGHRTCILWGRITAGLMALTTLAALIAALLAGGGGLLPVLLFAIACGCEAAIGLIESRVAYDRQTNPNA